MMNRLFGISAIPDDNLSFIITTSENAVMELIIADIFDLFFMVVEVAKRMDLVIFFFG